jgi:transcriptional regulator with XRE-family HTH domain
VYKLHGKNLGDAELDESQRVLLWELGRRIVRLRRTRSWSRGELAKRMRVSRERLGHWERGSHTPPLKALVGLSRELGTSVDELLTGESVEPRALSRQERDEAMRFFRELSRWLKTLLEDGAAEPALSEGPIRNG